MNISFSHTSRRFFIALIPTLITYNTLLFYGFPGNSVFYILLSLWFLVYLFMSWKKGLLLAFLLLGATILLNSLLGLMHLEDRIYYGTHERLKVYNHELELDSYRKNVDISVLIPFGDTIAMGTEKSIEIEPRRIRFRTDSLGFRNDGDYRGQKYVLVGDSLVMGGGSDQEDTLAVQLRDKYGVDAYSLTYAGGILEYVKCILYFQKKCKSDFRVLMFLFEGNDFAEGFSRRQFALKKPYMRALLDRYFSLYKRTILYRYTYIVMNRRSERPFPSEAITVDGHRIGEFSEYIRVARREEYRYPESVMDRVSLVADRIDHIFFIPTKFRVYYSFLQPRNEQPLPNAQWEAAKALGERFGIPCTDLTEPMIEESAMLLKAGKYTYWKDDSHWNRYGIGVVAKVVAEQLKVKK